MHKKKLTRTLAPLAAIIAVMLIYMAPMAFSQEDMVVVPTSDFNAPERPAAMFKHDAHNELAGLEDCVVCHHGKTDAGLIDLENSSDGESCSSCHPVKPENGATPLMRAYHLQCTTCHADALKGPVACGECHKK
ncbi:MAG: cytochrome c3 family protein [Pseudodesulfovibrio sp.]|nr:cytochrome c3 family protein [Pseudodesulfovibrio sp.]